MASSDSHNNQQEDPWADLFDRAEGKITTSTEQRSLASSANTTLKDDDDDDDHHRYPNPTAATENNSATVAKRPKLQHHQHHPGSSTNESCNKAAAPKRRKHKNGSSDNDDASFQKYLKERSSFQTQLWLEPSGIILNGGLSSSLSSSPSFAACPATSACQAWKGDAQEGQRKRKGKQQVYCQSCGRSSFYHRASIENHVPLQIYCLLRNLRHVAILFLTTSSSSNTTGDTTLLGQASAGINHTQTYFVDRALLGECQRLLKILQRVAVSQPEVSSSLQTKFAMLLTLLHQQQHAFQKRKQQSTTTSNPLCHQRQQQKREGAIRIIMQCDECYYQLYYLEITRQVSGLFVSFQRQQHQQAAGMYIPHPTVYFGESFTATSETGNKNIKNYTHKHYLDAARDWVSTTWNSLDHRCDSSVVARFQLDFEEAMGKIELDMDALSALHYIRFLETISFFDLPTDTSWLATASSSSSASSSLLSKGENTPLSSSSSASLTAPPPAPVLLMEWRDSCRDFLTHLYAYATLPPNVISFIIKTCRDEEIHNIIEVGAGTGYVAHLINVQQQQKGDVQSDIIGVEAYDLLPTTTPLGSSENCTGMNEYHGDTPPFTHVAKAGCTQALQNNMGINNSTTALLLCYPPPDSSMALDAVQSFCRSTNGSCNSSSNSSRKKKRRRRRHESHSNDNATALDTFTTCNAGSLVIYIGEFQGLTGTRSLERYLVQGFDCIARHACPTWGTDATSVTIWKARKHATTSSSSPSSLPPLLPILIPCHFCHVKPATKRLRIIRHLDYCSNACFQADCQSVYQHAKCSRLCFGSDDGVASTAGAATSGLDFENSQHFLNLDY